MSDRAVHQIWNICNEDTGQLSRGSFLKKVENILAPWQLECSTQEDFECVDGSSVRLPIMLLQPFLDKICKESCGFARTLRTALDSSPTLTPLVYADECTAGNVVGVDQARKCSLIYVSWVEFWHHLKHPNAWLPFAAVQANCLKEVNGGLSAVVVAVLKHLLAPNHCTGFTITCHDFPPLMFKQKPRAFYLGDNDSIRAIYSLKGSSGMRPCVHCKNVLMKGSNLIQFDDLFVEISSSTGFQSATDNEIFAAADALLTIRGQTALRRKEMVAGLRFDRASLLWTPTRTSMPPSHIVTDPMHSYLCNGVASWEVSDFLQAVFANTPVTLLHIQQAVTQGNWRASKTSNRTAGYLRRLFDSRLFGEALYKGQAHQTAAIVPLLHFYASTIIQPTNRLPEPILQSFLALSDILQCIRKMQHSVRRLSQEDANELAHLQRKHHQLYCLAFGADSVKPKHHHRFHIPENIQRTGCFLSCEALEQKHQLYKADIGHNQRSSVADYAAFSSQVLRRICHASLTNLVNTGLPFWELLPPITAASLDDCIQLAVPSACRSSSYRYCFFPKSFSNFTNGQVWGRLLCPVRTNLSIQVSTWLRLASQPATCSAGSTMLASSKTVFNPKDLCWCNAKSLI